MDRLGKPKAVPKNGYPAILYNESGDILFLTEKELRSLMEELALRFGKVLVDKPTELKEKSVSNVTEDLKDSVIKLLVSEFNYTIDDAEEEVNDSMSDEAEMWHENAQASDLAKYLAEESDED